MRAKVTMVFVTSKREHDRVFQAREIEYRVGTGQFIQYLPDIEGWDNQWLASQGRRAEPLPYTWELA